MVDREPREVQPFSFMDAPRQGGTLNPDGTPSGPATTDLAGTTGVTGEVPVGDADSDTADAPAVCHSRGPAEARCEKPDDADAHEDGLHQDADGATWPVDEADLERWTSGKAKGALPTQ